MPTQKYFSLSDIARQSSACVGDNMLSGFEQVQFLWNEEKKKEREINDNSVGGKKERKTKRF